MRLLAVNKKPVSDIGHIPRALGFKAAIRSLWGKYEESPSEWG